MGKLNRRIPKSSSSHWELIASSGEEYCFVCDKKFKKNERKTYVGKNKTDGSLLHRHNRCDALSENWKKKFGYSSLK